MWPVEFLFQLRPGAYKVYVSWERASPLAEFLMANQLIIRPARKNWGIFTLELSTEDLTALSLATAIKIQPAELWQYD